MEHKLPDDVSTAVIAMAVLGILSVLGSLIMSEERSGEKWMRVALFIAGVLTAGGALAIWLVMR